MKCSVKGLERATHFSRIRCTVVVVWVRVVFKVVFLRSSLLYEWKYASFELFLVKTRYFWQHWWVIRRFAVLRFCEMWISGGKFPPQLSSFYENICNIMSSRYVCVWRYSLKYVWSKRLSATLYIPSLVWYDWTWERQVKYAAADVFSPLSDMRRSRCILLGCWLRGEVS